MTELNLLDLICHKHNLHFSESGLSILMFQGLSHDKHQTAIAF